MAMHVPLCSGIKWSCALEFVESCTFQMNFYILCFIFDFVMCLNKDND